MPTYNYTSGLGNAAAFQVSGKPYVTGGLNGKALGGPYKIEFPSVTRWIVIANTDSAEDDMKFGFSANGIKGAGLNGDDNYFTLLSGQSQRLELKCTELWYTGSNQISVCAGLTGIPRAYIENNYTGSTGIG